MDGKKNDENENRLTSIDIKIDDKMGDENKVDGFSFSNLDYDENEISNLLGRKLSLYVKKKNNTIIILISIIISLILVLGISLYFIFKLKYSSKEKSKVCPPRCICNDDFQCIKCLDNTFLFLEDNKICLLKNFSFVAQYHSNAPNNDYRKNITRMRIERIYNDNINFTELEKENIITNYASYEKGEIYVYFNMNITGSNSTDKMFFNR